MYCPQSLYVVAWVESRKAQSASGMGSTSSARSQWRVWRPKLKLFNKEYQVVSRDGTRYKIRDVITGKEADVHVSQIARMRSHEDERVDDAAPLAEVQAGDTLPDDFYFSENSFRHGKFIFRKSSVEDFLKSPRGYFPGSIPARKINFRGEMNFPKSRNHD